MWKWLARIFARECPDCGSDNRTNSHVVEWGEYILALEAYHHPRAEDEVRQRLQHIAPNADASVIEPVPKAWQAESIRKVGQRLAGTARLIYWQRFPKDLRGAFSESAREQREDRTSSSPSSGGREPVMDEREIQRLKSLGLTEEGIEEEARRREGDRLRS